jgi:hypothetical protein
MWANTENSHAKQFNDNIQEKIHNCWLTIMYFCTAWEQRSQALEPNSKQLGCTAWEQRSQALEPNSKQLGCTAWEQRSQATDPKKHHFPKNPTEKHINLIKKVLDMLTRIENEDTAAFEEFGNTRADPSIFKGSYELSNKVYPFEKTIERIDTCTTSVYLEWARRDQCIHLDGKKRAYLEEMKTSLQAFIDDLNIPFRRVPTHPPIATNIRNTAATNTSIQTDKLLPWEPKWEKTDMPREWQWRDQADQEWQQRKSSSMSGEQNTQTHQSASSGYWTDAPKENQWWDQEWQQYKSSSMTGEQNTPTHQSASTGYWTDAPKQWQQYERSPMSSRHSSSAHQSASSGDWTDTPKEEQWWNQEWQPHKSSPMTGEWATPIHQSASSDDWTDTPKVKQWWGQEWQQHEKSPMLGKQNTPTHQSASSGDWTDTPKVKQCLAQENAPPTTPKYGHKRVPIEVIHVLSFIYYQTKDNNMEKMVNIIFNEYQNKFRQLFRKMVQIHNIISKDEVVSASGTQIFSVIDKNSSKYTDIRKFIESIEEFMHAFYRAVGESKTVDANIETRQYIKEIYELIFHIVESVNIKQVSKSDAIPVMNRFKVLAE